LRALADGDAAIAAASGYYVGRYAAEVTAEQERQVAIVEKALQQSVNDNLTSLQDRLERQHQDAAKGKVMALAIHTTNQQIDALIAELNARRADLARRRVTAIQTPRVVGVAGVIPGPVPAAWIAGPGGDKTAVEQAAMQIVIEYHIPAEQLMAVAKRAVPPIQPTVHNWREPPGRPTAEDADP
jgi:hypothetical protein